MASVPTAPGHSPQQGRPQSLRPISPWGAGLEPHRSLAPRWLLPSMDDFLSIPLSCRQHQSLAIPVMSCAPSLLAHRLAGALLPLAPGQSWGYLLQNQ